MTSLNDGRITAFQNQPYSVGIRLQVQESIRNPGFFKANETATWRQGQLLALNSSGELIAATGTGVVGVAKFHKNTVMLAAVVDEPVVLNGTTASNLAHANVSNVRVSSATGMGVTPYVITTDYTQNTTNGTITRAGGGGITDGATVYVSYHFQLTTSQQFFQGHNFYNLVDDISVNEGRVSLVQAPGKIFTTEFAYNSGVAYAVGSKLYCDANGLFSNSSAAAAAGDLVGRVFQMPTANDPWMGVELLMIPA